MIREIGLPAIVVVTLVASVIAQTPAPPSDVASTIRRLEATRRQALLEGNVDVIASLLADDFLEIDGTGAMRHKADNIAGGRSGRITWLEATATDEEVRVFGSVAIFTATMRNRTAVSGQPGAPRVVRVSRTYMQRAGKWLCIHAQSTLIAQ